METVRSKYIVAFLVLCWVLCFACMAAAASVATVGFCCKDGKLKANVFEKECKEVGGKYYPAKGKLTAAKECRLVKGSCCANGKLKSATAAECKKLKGKYYKPGLEAAAEKECRPEEGSCCVKGKLKSATAAECKKLKGKYYKPGREAAAKKECRPEEGSCCVKGNLKSATAAECKKLKGKYYKPGRETAAEKECRSKQGSCCVNGELKKTDEKVCKRLNGIYYKTGQEKQAKKECFKTSEFLSKPAGVKPDLRKLDKKNDKRLVRPIVTAKRPEIPKPDLEAVRIWSETAGDLNQIAVEFRNNGPIALSEALLGRIKVSANISEHSEMTADLPRALLNVGGTAIVRFEPGRPLTARSMMWGRIDSTGLLNERDETNNYVSGHVGGEADLPDLVGRGFTYDRQADSMYVGTSDRHLHFSFNNRGSALTNSQWRSLRVEITVGTTTKNYLVRDVVSHGNLDGLNSGVHSFIMVSIPVTEFRPHGTQNISAFIDHLGVITESNESNNTVTASRDFGPLRVVDEVQGTMRAHVPNMAPPPDPSDMAPEPEMMTPRVPVPAPAGGRGVPKSLPLPTIRILTPTAATFFTAPGEMAIVAEWLDPSFAGAPPVTKVEIKDEEDRVIASMTGAPSSPASGSQNVVRLSIPGGTMPDEYKVRWEGVEHWGESDVFRISSLASDHNGLTISAPVAGDRITSRRVRVLWQGWGDNCNPDETYSIWLFKTSSSGPEHQHWLLDTGTSREERTVTLPASVENGDDYFLRIDIGSLCDGTTGFFSIDR